MCSDPEPADVRPLASTPPYQPTRHDQAHDLVRAFENLMHAQVAHDLFDPVIGQIAVAAVELQSVVGDLEADIGGEALGHGAAHGYVRIAPVVSRCGGVEQDPRAASNSVAMSAKRNWSAWNSTSAFPKARRSRM